MSRLRAPATLLHSGDELTDDELVQAVRTGDESAFAELFKRHSRFVARLAGRFFPRSNDVEGLVQDTFVEAFVGLDRYRGGNERSFVAWLKRIAITTCCDALRRAQARGETRNVTLDEKQAAALNSRWQGAARTAEQSVILSDLAGKLLARLAPEDRLVLTLINAEELSVSDVAELTGWSEAKVKVRAHRARKALRAMVDPFVQPLERKG